VRVCSSPPKRSLLQITSSRQEKPLDRMLFKLTSSRQIHSMVPKLGTVRPRMFQIQCRCLDRFPLSLRWHRFVFFPGIQFHRMYCMSYMATRGATGRNPARQKPIAITSFCSKANQFIVSYLDVFSKFCFQNRELILKIENSCRTHCAQFIKMTGFT